jgi:hypothetical protein
VPLLVAPVPPPCEPPPRRHRRRVHPVESSAHQGSGQVAIPARVKVGLPTESRLSLGAAPSEVCEASMPCVVFEKPCLFPAVSKCAPRPVLHFSLVAQMDGVLYKELKVRPEVDVLAVSSSVAVTRCWGVPRDGVGHPLPS